MLDFSPEVQFIYDKTKKLLDGDDNPLHSTFSHIVWGDGNLEDSDVEWCLQEYKQNEILYLNDPYPKSTLEIVKRSLEELLEIRECNRLI